ncbi:uncharacterized protein VTP21DRAFT_4529 [Calcarisporiella thermophila]|uniref:uncharacterized protein n=1 Tax=Calcarisporiella thermophila TaxID=911321 RepID=UPI0037438BE5
MAGTVLLGVHEDGEQHCHGPLPARPAKNPSSYAALPQAIAQGQWRNIQEKPWLVVVGTPMCNESDALSPEYGLDPLARARTNNVNMREQGLSIL